MRWCGPYDAVELEWVWRDLDVHTRNTERRYAYEQVVQYHSRLMGKRGQLRRWPWQKIPAGDNRCAYMNVWAREPVPPIPAPSVRSIEAGAPVMWAKFRGGKPLTDLDLPPEYRGRVVGGTNYMTDGRVVEWKA